MGNNDLNVNIPIGVTPNVSGPITDIKREMAGLRADLEKPIRSSLDFDLSGIDAAERRLKSLNATAAKGVGVGGGANRGGSSSALGDVYGPAVKPRFDAYEQQVRGIQTGIIKGMERRADAERKVAMLVEAEAEARRRLFGSLPKPSARPERQAIRDAEQNALARGVNPLSKGESNYARSNYNGNRIQQATMGRGLGKEATSIGGNIFKAEDKLNLGGGFKVIGQIATAASIAEIAGKTLQAIPKLQKEYADRTKIGMGGIGGAAEMAAGKVADHVYGLGTLARGFRTVFDGRQQQQADVRDAYMANQDQAEQQRRARDGAILRGRDVLGGLAGELAGGSSASRIRNANLTDPSGLSAAREAASAEAAATSRTLAGRMGDLVNQQSGPNRLDSGDYEKAKASIGQLQDQAKAKLIDDLADIDKQESARRAAAATDDVNQRKANETTLFSVRQAYLGKEGSIVQANLEAVDKSAKDARAEAYARERKVTSDFKPGSAESRAAQDTLKQQLGAIDAGQGVNRAAIMEQARRDSVGTLASGLQARAAFGDTGAAKRASDLIIDQQTEERRRQLQNIISSNALDSDRLAEAKQQLADLKGLSAKQKSLAQQQIDEQEKARRSGIVSGLIGNQAGELRRLADRTGNRGYGIQADALSTADEYRQRADALRQQLKDPNTKADEKTAIQGALDRLPAQFQATIGDLSRAKVTSSDFIRGANANAEDAGALTGLAGNAREEAQASYYRQTGNIDSNLQKLTDAILKNIQTGGAAPLPGVATYTYRSN